jgi:hypothetical protein
MGDRAITPLQAGYGRKGRKITVLNHEVTYAVPCGQKLAIFFRLEGGRPSVSKGEHPTVDPDH